MFESAVFETVIFETAVFQTAIFETAVFEAELLVTVGLGTVVLVTLGAKTTCVEALFLRRAPGEPEGTSPGVCRGVPRSSCNVADSGEGEPSEPTASASRSAERWSLDASRPPPPFRQTPPCGMSVYPFTKGVLPSQMKFSRADGGPVGSSLIRTYRMM